MKRKATKELLHSGLKGSKLTQQQLQVVAYNLFNGQKLAVMLRDATDNGEGIQRVEAEIRSRFCIENAAITEMICRHVCAALMTIESCEDISRRYQFSALRGGLL